MTETVAPRRYGLRRLSRLYMACLALVAFVVLATSVIHLRRVRAMESDGSDIALVGRQRMLTERMVVAALQLMGANDASVATTSASFAKARAEWRSGYERISVIVRSQIRPRSTDARDLLLVDQLQEAALRRARVESVADAAVAPASGTVAAVERAATAERLVPQADSLVASIDRIVASLVSQQRVDIEQVERLVILTAAALLLLLVLQTFLVFRPALLASAQAQRMQRADNVRLHEQAERLVDTGKALEMTNEELAAQRADLLRNQEQLEAQHGVLVEQRETLLARTRELTRLGAIMDATPDPVAVFSVDGELEYANTAAHELMAKQRAHPGWRGLYRMFAPWAARQLRDTTIPQAIAEGVWQGESSIRSSDGVERTFLQTVLAHYGSDGSVRTMSSILHDITQSKQLQRAMAEREAHYRAIIDALAEGVVVQDHEGKIVSWNQSAERVLGLTGDQLSGRTSMDPQWRVVNANDEPMAGEEHPIMRARLTGEHVDGVVQGVHRGDGAVVWLSVNARPMFVGNLDDNAGAVATFTDITQSRATAGELETMSVVAQQSDYAVATMDPALRVTWVNGAWERLTGYDLEEVKGQLAAPLSEGPQTSTEEVARRKAAVLAEVSFSGELLNYRKDGSPYWRDVTLTPIKNANGVTTGWVSLSRDVTARRVADRERKQLAAALAVTADGIAITDVSGAIEFVNHSFARMNRARPEELIGTPWSALHEPSESMRLVREAIPIVTNVGFWQGDVTGRRLDGSLYPQELSLTLLPLGGMVKVARDVTERHAVQEQLRFLSLRDGLTGLFNRRGFVDHAERLLELARRQGKPCALLYGDLDSFKQINDRFGHAVGDLALTETASILTGAVRNTDLVARLGGDEFSVLAFDVAQDDVSRLLERVEIATKASNIARGADTATNWTLGMSLGVAYFNPGTAQGVEALMQVADAAQYVEKARRKAVRASAPSPMATATSAIASDQWCTP